MHGKLRQRSNVCPKEATQPHCMDTSIGGQLPVLALSAGSCATPGQWLRCSEHQPQPGRREVWRAPARAAGLLAGSRGYGSTWRCREERESGDRERKSLRAPSRGQGRKKHSCPGNTPDKLRTTAAGAAEGPGALLPAVRPLCPLPVRQALCLHMTQACRAALRSGWGPCIPHLGRRGGDVSKSAGSLHLRGRSLGGCSGPWS